LIRIINQEHSCSKKLEKVFDAQSCTMIKSRNQPWLLPDFEFFLLLQLLFFGWQFLSLRVMNPCDSVLKENNQWLVRSLFSWQTPSWGVISRKWRQCSQSLGQMHIPVAITTQQQQQQQQQPGTVPTFDALSLLKKKSAPLFFQPPPHHWPPLSRNPQPGPM